MIVKEATVGKDNRAVGFCGKDTLFRVVDGMSQCIYVISPELYIRNILYISLKIQAAVRQLFAQICLDSHIKNLPVQADTVTDTFRVEILQVPVAPFHKHMLVFFHNQLLVLVKRDMLHFFFRQHTRVTLIMKDILIRIIRPLPDLRHFLNLPQRAVRMLQFAFYVTSLCDVPILAEHHVVIRIHETFKIIRLIFQHQLEILADASLLFKHFPEDWHYPLPCIFRQKFEYILP